MFELALLAIAVIAAPADALPRDGHSHAEAAEVVVRAVDLDSAVDFGSRERV